MKRAQQTLFGLPEYARYDEPIPPGWLDWADDFYRVANSDPRAKHNAYDPACGWKGPIAERACNRLFRVFACLTRTKDCLWRNEEGEQFGRDFLIHPPCANELSRVWPVEVRAIGVKPPHDLAWVRREIRSLNAYLEVARFIPPPAFVFIVHVDTEAMRYMITGYHCGAYLEHFCRRETTPVPGAIATRSVENIIVPLADLRHPDQFAWEVHIRDGFEAPSKEHLLELEEKGRRLTCKA
jgi:hypothetical protein